MIKPISHVDEVSAYTDVDKIVQEINLDVFVTGTDQCHVGFQRAIQWCEEHGKEHIVLGRTVGVSSRELISNKYDYWNSWRNGLLCDIRFFREISK